MPIDPIGAGTTTTTPEPIIKPANDQFGTDTFLNLLVAQLKYQNPMSPSDGTQFLAQTAQFTMVEKLTQLAEVSEHLLADNQALAASSLLGRTISWADADGNIQSGIVTSAAFGSEGATVLVGEERIPLSQVRDVRATEPAAAPEATDSTATDPTETDPTATDPTGAPVAPVDDPTDAPTTSQSSPPA